MIPTTKKWEISSFITPEVENELQGYPPILRQILFNRGYSTHESARQYLKAEKPPRTSPVDLSGISEAVARIQKAITKDETIAIYGDYDVDGVTATALLMQYLRIQGVTAIGYIPDRFEEGYGLNNDALESLKNDGVSLVITVDCGIRSIDEANFAHKIGLDLIISDHHHPGNEIPSAIAVIDPKQVNDTYPEKELAGVGLAYKLIEAFNSHQEHPIIDHRDFLDLVALGTVADLAPLVGENRYLVRKGLEYIRKPRRQGIMSLIGVSGLNPRQISATDIGFALGPRLNAAGRLESAQAALELLLTRDVGKAAYLAQELEIRNRERQKITRTIQAQAEEIATSIDSDPLILFAVHPDFNPGVVGLAASRLTDQFYRPSIVGQIGNEFTRASCRSIHEFHITSALDQCSDLMEYYGGHAAAAGFTIRNENLSELHDRLKVIAVEQLSTTDLRPTIKADVEIPLSELDPRIIEYLDWLEPTGYGNPQALFCSRDLIVRNSRTVGKENSHLKMTVSDGWVTYDAIAFRQGQWQEHMPSKIDLMYTFEVNEFRGRKSLQLNVRDLKPSGMDLV
jgi:single-stranded-DNA-specific exonuclease